MLGLGGRAKDELPGGFFNDFVHAAQVVAVKLDVEFAAAKKLDLCRPAVEPAYAAAAAAKWAFILKVDPAVVSDALGGDRVGSFDRVFQKPPGGKFLLARDFDQQVPVKGRRSRRFVGLMFQQGEHDSDLPQAAGTVSAVRRRARVHGAGRQWPARRGVAAIFR